MAKNNIFEYQAQISNAGGDIPIFGTHDNHAIRVFRVGYEELVVDGIHESTTTVVRSWIVERRKFLIPVQETPPRRAISGLKSLIEVDTW